MSYAAFWPTASKKAGPKLPWALLIAVLVAMTPYSNASSTKSSSSSKPATHAAAPPAAHTASPAPGAPHSGGVPPSGGRYPSNGSGGLPPSSNGRPPSSNGVPPSSNGHSSSSGAAGLPPSSNGHSAGAGAGALPPSGAGRPGSSGVPGAASTGHNTYQPGSRGTGVGQGAPAHSATDSHAAAGDRTVTSLGGRQVSVIGKDGQPKMTRVQQPDMVRTTQRLPGGTRVVETQHNVAGVGVVRTTSYGAGRGVVERPVFGHPCCIRRSYLVGNRSYAVVYRGYRYQGVVYYRPVPAYIYSPAFYTWTVQPWGSPVPYAWGWAGQPWYVAYGPVFTPYTTYGSFNSWMTDYVISSNLQQAYDAGRADGESAAQEPPPAITPEMKQQFSDQVQDSLSNQQQQADAAQAASQPNAVIAPVTEVQDDTPDALRPGHVLFRVVNPLTVSVNGQSCALTANDWVWRTGDLDQDGMVPVLVKASRTSDCQQGSTTLIALNDLMVMQGDVDQQVRDGVQYASKNAGKNGLPGEPAPGAAPIALGTTVADANLSKTFQQQQQDATNDETQARTAATGQGGTF